MTIECAACGYSCGTRAAFERHASRFPPGEHTPAVSVSAPSNGDDEALNEKLSATHRLVAAAEVGDAETVRAAVDAGANVDGL